MSDQADLDAVIAALQDGELACFPTETLWSLSCLPEAGPVARLRMMKRRPVHVPLALGMGAIDDVSQHVELTAVAKRLADRFLPGPLSLVVPRRSDQFQCLAPSQDTLSLRVPDHATARSVLAATGPLVMTSANEHGAPDPLSREELAAAVGHRVPAVGDAVPGIASTVVDCTGDRPIVLREGAVVRDEILAAFRS